MEKGRPAMAEVQEPLQWRRGKGLLWRKPEIRYGREEKKAHYNGEGKKANYNGARDLLWWREEGQLRRKPEIHYGREGKKACYGESLRSATIEKGRRHLPWYSHWVNVSKACESRSLTCAKTSAMVKISGQICSRCMS
ncbi:hypothetical protein B296_00035163 [Ensete ventricosum]|uniref:Uncharacterized protein n=1 Tax=Ensete ventricosum TaxID=4639 RepID=A0A426ZVR4_ENSVE|nr:hypothetical protein B296_00035163 [Ensete ventricosum]